ncbi:MAG: hypothetical protein PVH46_10370 [Granulosicoccaceae bacterium]|jgi:hypothetical protein
MAVRMKTRWHRSRRSQRNIEGSRKEKTMTDLAGVIAFNIWKLTKEIYANMEKEGYRFGEDSQVIDFFSEIIAYMIAVADRMVYGKITEEQRTEFVTALATDLLNMMISNKEDLLGPGDYRDEFVSRLNARLGEYAECDYDEEKGPSYAFKRLLGSFIADVMASTDSKWVLEHIMDYELPKHMGTLKRLVRDVLGLKKSAKQTDAE